MAAPQPFLTAEWRKLILANYEIDSKVLTPFLPAGTEVDSWEDRTYVSYVGFLFDQVKVKGLSIPYHQSFPEFNLRFYVRFKMDNKWHRGVTFIKEIVPKRMVSLVANTVYGEHYQTLPMEHFWDQSEHEQSIEYRFRWKKDWNYIRVKASNEPMLIKPNSEAEYITQQVYGVTRLSANRTDLYEVEHPLWEVYPMHQLQFGVHTSALFGDEFIPFLETKPVSTFLAEGSAIKVFPGKRLV
ncbi:MAG: DUF2071 domain-containing protein [Cytophagaceae bacterium]